MEENEEFFTKNHHPRDSFPKQVGKYYLRIFTYKDCYKDNEGYIDPKRYLPHTNDLIHVMIERKKEKLSKIFTAWWNGFNWDGSQIIKGDKIIKWKKKEENDEPGNN